tara:strand:- start:16260 stop:18071 length:1812 start_codon:yes stop_codon:yes gene_type:complete
MLFNKPYLFLEWDKINLNVSINKNNVNNGLRLNINEECFDYQHSVKENSEIIIIGNPIINEEINFDKTIDFLYENDFSLSAQKKINGQFLIIIIKKLEKQLVIINDRFNSIHFYYSNLNNRFLASFLYFDLFKVLRKEKNFQINSYNILQFLWMSRVMGDLTYDNFSHYMLPANNLLVNIEKCEKYSYWRPNFEKISRTKKEAGEKYISLLKKSIKRLTTEKIKNKYGYFFSSGLDSRTVATAISLNNKKLDSFTVAFNNNLEVKYAKIASETANSRHHFIQLSKNHFEKNLEQNIIICGGMYTIHDALFTGLKEDIQKKCNIVFHGHALDFWHYGNYLPSYFVKILGSQTFIRKIMKIDDVSELYFKYNPLRLTWTNKSLDLNKVFLKKYYNHSIQSIKNAIQSDINSGKDICKNKLDQWEYLLLHAFGRHFTNINITSKLTCAKVRTPAFDNEIMDFYTSIPNKQRITDEIRIYALNNMGPKIGKIPSANHGFLAGDSHITKTIKLVLRKITRIITRNNKYSSPTLKDRTWPELNSYLRESDYLTNEIEQIFKNSELKSILFMIDWEYLYQKFNDWKKGNNFDPIFWFSLITISRLLIMTK